MGVFSDHIHSHKVHPYSRSQQEEMREKVIESN